MKCRFEHDGDCCNSGATQYMCKCKQPCDTIMPITNAERIRTMSDEELATLIDYVSAKHPFCRSPEERCPVEGCNHCILEWLKQPAKENDERMGR